MQVLAIVLAIDGDRPGRDVLVRFGRQYRIDNPLYVVYTIAASGVMAHDSIECFCGPLESRAGVSSVRGARGSCRGSRIETQPLPTEVRRSPVATCTDSRNEVNNRRRGEPAGSAYESEGAHERVVMSSKEVGDVSPGKVTSILGRRDSGRLAGSPSARWSRTEPARS
jgi:hypothetical protein